MATNAFGDTIDEAPQRANVNAFGDTIESSAAGPTAFEQQYIASQQPDFLRTATTPLRVGGEALAGLLSSLQRGVQGAGELAGQASTTSNPGLTAQRNLVQTQLESIPQLAKGLIQGGQQGLSYAIDKPMGALRNVAAFANPIPVAIQESIAGAIRGSPAAPSQDEIAKALARELSAQEAAKTADQPILPEIIGTANIPLSQAIPDLIATAAASPEFAPGVTRLASRIAPVARETLRTGATIATTPLSAYRAGAKAQPFLSGEAAAEAGRSLEDALRSQGAAQRDIAQASLREGAAQEAVERSIAGQRGEAATLGRESLEARRALTAEQKALGPQIATAKTSLAEAAQSPVVILGKTASEPAAFGSEILSGIDKPLKASKEVYTNAYNEVKNSLPDTQPKLESPRLFESASQAKQELSEGFQAYNKGEIKQILDESSKITRAESSVPADIKDIYDSASSSVKNQLEAQYPGLTAPAKTTLPMYTWNELQNRFRQINEGMEQAIKHGDTGDVRILAQLKEGIVDDMASYANRVGGNTNELFQNANKLYKAHEDKFGLNRIQSIFRDDVVQNPQMVAQKLISDNNAPMVEAIKGIVTPAEFEGVKAQFSQRLFSPDIETPFDPSHFVKKFRDGSTHETLRAVYGEEGFKRLQDVYEASKGFDKIANWQKTLDNLTKEAESSGAAFRRARGGVSEAEAVQAEKARLAESLRPLRDADVADKLGTAARRVEDARRELDRIKNFKDLKDWARRASGLNILQAAAVSPAGLRLTRTLGAIGIGGATPQSEDSIADGIMASP